MLISGNAMLLVRSPTVVPGGMIVDCATNPPWATEGHRHRSGAWCRSVAASLVVLTGC